MSGIFGLLGLSDTDRSYVNTIGQSAVYDAIQQYMMRLNADMQAASSIFVETTTTDFKERYYLPGGGRLQLRGGLAQSAAVKAAGSWDVAYPLNEYGAAMAGDDISLAYMNMQQLSRHLQTVQNQAAGTMRVEILNAIFNNAQDSHVDPINGTLAVEPLANGDAVVYPPVIGSDSEATETHYAESGYAASAISDTNNPIVTIVDELEEHFGSGTGGENNVIFINNAQTAKIKALSDFDEVPDRFIRTGDSISVPTNLPSVPGKIIGRGSGAWIVEWRWIPANYLFGMNLEQPAPLKMRVDPADTGLGTGLQLVRTSDHYPLQQSHYRWRFGLGCGNRLNGFVMELGTGGTYSVPTIA